AVFRRPEFLATAQDIADRGVTLLRNDGGLVPLDPRTTKRVLLLAVSADPDTIPAEPFERELRSQLDSVDSLHVDTKYFRVEETHLPSPDSYDLAICALTVRVADRKGSVGLPADESAMVHALLHAGKPVIMVGLGSPYLQEGFPEAQTWVAAFSVQDVAQRSAARVVLGQVAASGKLPVSLPGAAPHALHVGDGMTTAAIPLTLQPAGGEIEARLQGVFELLDESVGEKTLRGGVLAISYQGRQIVHRFGQRGGGAESEGDDSAAFPWTLPNVPLLTTAIARLAEVKELSLDTPVAAVLQGTSVQPPHDGWRGVTIRQVLEHTSGLEAVLPRTGPATSEVLRFAAASQVRDTFPYADAGIASLIVSTLTGQPYPEAPDDMILAPLRQRAGGDSASRADADSMEARARDALILGQLWMNGGIYAHRRLLTRKTVEQFLAPKRQGDVSYTAGWEISPAPGHSFSPKAFGFTASEGASLWVDPAHELSVAFLPDAGAKPAGEAPPGDAHLGALRAEIHDAIYSALVLKK
ncbi:MAG TPA: serine hydrolase, partial [Candidatus Acidoferrales bacterium]|nr:serine hydrolase [Candidatus Acidoferrales bacterium]